MRGTRTLEKALNPPQPERGEPAFARRIEAALARKWVKPAILFVVLIMLWEIMVRVHILKPVQVPPPSVVLITLAGGFFHGDYLLQTGITFYRVLVSFGIAIVFGLLIGLLIGRYASVARTFEPFIYMAYPVPMIAFLGVFIVWFGFGDTTKIIIPTLSAFFPVAINTIVGVRKINPLVIRAARDLGTKEVRLLKDIIFPASLPIIFGGLKLGGGLAFLATIVVEMLMGADRTGLGYLVQDAGFSYTPEVAFAVAAVVGIMGILFNSLIEFAHKRSVPWQEI